MPRKERDTRLARLGFVLLPDDAPADRYGRQIRLTDSYPEEDPVGAEFGGWGPYHFELIVDRPGRILVSYEPPERQLEKPPEQQEFQRYIIRDTTPSPTPPLPSGAR